MQPKVLQTLEKIGFSRNESLVYGSLVELGSAKAGKVAKHIQLDRSSCYNALKTLLEKGVISYVVISNVKWFQATNPRRILEYLKEQRSDVEQILPMIELQYKAAKVEGQVTLYKGTKGIQTVFQDLLRNSKKDDENFVFGSEGQFAERLPFFAPGFLRELEKKGVKTKNLVRHGRKGETGKYATTRYLPDVESPVVTNIYGNKIALIIWTDTPEAVMIENKAAADAYRNYFKFMWKHAGK